jgi:hypothetical protein
LFRQHEQDGWPVQPVAGPTDDFPSVPPAASTGRLGWLVMVRAANRPVVAGGGLTLWTASMDIPITSAVVVIKRHSLPSVLIGARGQKLEYFFSREPAKNF